MSAPLHFYMVPKDSIQALHCRNLFCARKQPQYGLKRQCLPASLEKLYRADLSCPPSLTWVTSADYTWRKEVGSHGWIWTQEHFPNLGAKVLSDCTPGEDLSMWPVPPLCQAVLYKAWREGHEGWWCGLAAFPAQLSSDQGHAWACGGATEPRLLI